MTGVTQSSVLASIDDGILDYANVSHDGGEVDRFQCVECGQVIKDSNSMTINTPEELVAWLKKNKMA
jgi:hypothetical protein